MNKPVISPKTTDPSTSRALYGLTLSILESPGDPTPRLALSDLLEELGAPREDVRRLRVPNGYYVARLDTGPLNPLSLPSPGSPTPKGYKVYYVVGPDPDRRPESRVFFTKGDYGLKCSGGDNCPREEDPLTLTANTRSDFRWVCCSCKAKLDRLARRKAKVGSRAKKAKKDE